MPWNIPILLTWSRILMIPLFTALFYLPASWRVGIQTVNTCAAALFVLAAVTDWFDGYLARKWKQTSDFGAFLDPVADKLMVAVALILLVRLDRTWVLTLWSMFYYLKMAAKEFKQPRPPKAS